MAKHNATMIHHIFHPTKSGNPVSKDKRLHKPPNKAIAQTPATSTNRAPDPQTVKGV